MDYISSSGISIIIRLQHKLLEKESRLVYFGFNKEISLVLNFFGLTKEIPIADNSNNAVKLLNPNHDAFSKESEIYSIEEDSDSESEIVITDLSKTSEYEPISIQVSEPKSATILEPEIAKKIKSNRFTLTEEHETLEEIATSPIEEVFPDPILESVTPKYPELKIKLPFITRTETNPSRTTIMDSITDFETDHTERYDVNTLSNVSDTNFTVLVVNCGNCGSKIRIRKQGKQQCPKCGYKFLLRQSGSISTIERL